MRGAMGCPGARDTPREELQKVKELLRMNVRGSGIT